MFGLRPSAPTRPEDYAVRPRWTAAQKRPGEASRAHAAAARAAGRRRPARRAARGAGPVGARARRLAERRRRRPRALDGNAPRPGLAAAGADREPRPQRRAGARRATGWCGPTHGCARRPGLAGTDPRSVAAYLDEPSMAHFARELDEAAVAATATDQGDGPLDVRVIECAVAGGYGGDAAAADAATMWIAETLRRGIPKGRRRAGIPRAPGRHAPSQHAQRRLVCRWL